MTAERVDDEFTSTVHVYEPHRVGLPRLRPYFRELWRRREFAAELSKSSMRSAHTTTVFGQLWLVLNPLLLAMVYFILVNILSGASLGAPYFAHLIGGLFVFYFVSGSITSGAASVVGGGKLLMNTPFPRMLLPLSAVRTAFFRFLPTLIIYIPVHIFAGLPFRLTTLLAVVFLAFVTLFGCGMAMIFATMQVYFRDTSNFLPYFLRIWLYLSPVLWFPEQAPAKFQDLMIFNPLYSLLGGWADLLVRAQMPAAELWVGAAFWSVLAAVVGGLFFMSREREFVVRL